jgi:hypothetical protein
MNKNRIRAIENRFRKNEIKDLPYSTIFFPYVIPIRRALLCSWRAL